MYEILEERKDTVIVNSNNDGVLVVPKTPYFVIKYRHFDGNRIFYKFDENSRIEETYNRGIFNCYTDLRLEGVDAPNNGKTRMVQIADSDGIARTILEQDAEKFKEIFVQWFSAKLQHKIIDMVIGAQPDRVRLERDMYVVDDFFGVDFHGVSHFRRAAGDKWNHLCLVVHGNTDARHALLPDEGDVTIDKLTMTTLAKIAYLLCPKLDKVVKGQLPGFLIRRLEKAGSITGPTQREV